MLTPFSSGPLIAAVKRQDPRSCVNNWQPFRPWRLLSAAHGSFFLLMADRHRLTLVRPSHGCEGSGISHIVLIISSASDPTDNSQKKKATTSRWTSGQRPDHDSRLGKCLWWLFGRLFKRRSSADREARAQT